MVVRGVLHWVYRVGVHGLQSDDGVRPGVSLGTAPVPAGDMAGVCKQPEGASRRLLSAGE